MSEKFTCPRRAESGADIPGGVFKGHGPNKDEFYERDGIEHCSYCGSISGEKFMELAKSHTEVEPTDKSYKFYMRGEGLPFIKFYTPHLSVEQGDEFITLWKAQQINWGYPGYPYVRLLIPHTHEPVANG